MFTKKEKQKASSNESKKRAPFFQAKLKVGKPGDKYEVEADKMADKVVNNEATSNTVQKKEGEEEVQQKPLASEISPLIQKMETAEEEPVQKMEEEEPVQKMEEEEPVQKMEEEESVQKMEEEESVQKMEEEEPVQKMEEEESVQKMEEEEVQQKEEEEVQAKSKNNNNKSPSIEGKLRNESGGTKMDAQTKNEMESGFGADFSKVNIHNDNEAAQMSQDVGAQAFTHGNDVYFNQGKYNPGSKEGKHLLAHELTHTIQQKGMVQKKIQKKDLQSPRFKNNASLENILDKKAVAKMGDKGAHIRIIQQALLDAGLTLPKYGVDGDFGRETKAAVEAFQRLRKLSKKETNGVVEDLTIEELDKHYTGYKTENEQFGGITQADLKKRNRSITSKESDAVKDTMSTEVKKNPITGKLPTFDIKNKVLYKKELKKLTQLIATRQYDILGKGKKALRSNAKNLHSGKTINGIADVSKKETDKVFGNLKKGKPLEFGKNIFDGWKNKEAQLVGKSKIQKDAIQKGWAEWRIQKIVQGNSMAPINKKYGAVQSRNPEKGIVQQIINELSVSYKKELVQTHLGWPGFAYNKKVFIQRFKSNSNEGNRQFMWENFGTIIHEYIHTLEHVNAVNYRSKFSEKKGNKVLREGVTDYFTKIVWNNIKFKEIALRKSVEGSYYDNAKNDIPNNSYYSEAKNAEKIAGIVGISNLMSYFFLGNVKLIKGK